MAVTGTIDTELADFFHRGRKQIYKKGEIILRAGDTPQGIYLIESGYIKIYALSNDATEHSHLFYLPGDIFPIIWAFTDAVRNVYYEAMQETVVWLVAKDEFKAFADSHAHVAVSLLEQAVNMFRLYAGRIDNLLYSNSHERTAYYLLSIMDRLGEKQPDGSWLVKVPVTHQDIANSVSLSRETVSRCMERLQRKDIIAYDSSRRIIIRDIAALAKSIGRDEAVGMWPYLSEYPE
ncbi:MAG TPA: Crp/Fnr family transcriptional regulator [Candidatus Saccharimonadales bacterium]|nr:Crp/Fnr family transcriptional regulator [Candidatus Saccharimonadales bacterium]